MDFPVPHFYFILMLMYIINFILCVENKGKEPNFYLYINNCKKNIE